MGSLKYGHDRYKWFKRILNDSIDYLYIGTAWMTPNIAELIIDICGAPIKVIILSDAEPYNIKSYKVLKDHAEVYHDELCHYKYLITESAFITGSTNFTSRGFFRQENCFEVRFQESDHKAYTEYLSYHNFRVSNSVPYKNLFNSQPKKKKSGEIGKAWKLVIP